MAACIKYAVKGSATLDLTKDQSEDIKKVETKD